VDYDGGQYEDRSEVEFDWAPPQRTPVNGTTPVPGQEKSLAVRNGQVNNADLVIAFPLAWASGVATTLAGVVTASIHLYRIIDSGRSLLRVVSLATLLANGELEIVSSTMARASIEVARGLVGDGFEATVSVPALAPGEALVAPGFGHRGATGRLWSWGCETAPTAEITISGATTVPVQIVSPLPLPVLERIPAAGTDVVAVAPHGGVATAVGATPVTSSVLVSADLDNTGRVYFGFAALVIGAMSVQLGPGDSARLTIDNTSKLFVNADAAGQKYRVAIT